VPVLPEAYFERRGASWALGALGLVLSDSSVLSKQPWACHPL
jgi:hypothetical protein